MTAIRSSFTLQFSDLTPISLATPVCFYRFQHVSLKDLGDLVNRMKITTTSLDILPSEIIKATFSEIGPSVQVLSNSSLDAGLVLNYFKHAVVQPLLKKQGLDEDCLNNYRPVSKLSFLSKLLEKVVQSQLILFLN